VFFNRKEATEYVRRQGFPIGPNRLADEAVKATGPEYQYAGRYALYTQEALDNWIQRGYGT
jgi:hypothetical protein